MHFLGTVIGPESESEVDYELERWSENADVEPYVVEYREDFLERAREWALRRPDVDGSDEDALLGRFARYTGAELDEDGNNTELSKARCAELAEQYADTIEDNLWNQLADEADDYDDSRDWEAA